MLKIVELKYKDAGLGRWEKGLISKALAVKRDVLNSYPSTHVESLIHRDSDACLYVQHWGSRDAESLFATN